MKKYILTIFIALAAGFVNHSLGQLRPPPAINPTIQNIWKTVPKIDTPMVSAASFVIGTKLYVVTGDTSSKLTIAKHSNQLWAYDTTTKKWSRKADFPGKPRIGAIGLAINGKGYMGGGRKLWTPKDTMVTLGDIVNGDTITIHKEEYDYYSSYKNTSLYTKIKVFENDYDELFLIEDSTKNKSQSLIRQSLYYGNKYPAYYYSTSPQWIRIINSYSFPHTTYRGDSVLNDFWMYDVDSNKWFKKKDIPGTKMGRAYPAGFVIDTTGYIGLGYDNDTIKFVSYTENKRVDKFYNGVKIVNGVIVTIWKYDTVIVSRDIVFSDDILPLKDLWKYNVAADTWTRSADFIGPPRSSTTNFTLDTAAFVGLGRDVTTVFDDCYLFNKKDSSWKKVKSFPAAPRFGATGFSLGFLGYVVGGSDGLPRRDFYEYNKVSDDWDRLPDFPDSARSFGVGGVIGKQAFFGNGSDLKKLYPEFRSWLLDSNRVFIKDISREPSFFSSKTNPVDSICAGDTFYIKIKKRSEFKKDTTIFYAEFSDSSGSFFYPLTFDSTRVYSESATDIILKVYSKPDSLLTSRAYKVRVNSINPSFNGNAYDSAIFIRQHVKVTQQPQPATSCLGATALFRVFVPIDTSYKDIANYEWFKDGVKLTDPVKYTGLDNDTLIINNTQLSDAGLYKVAVSGYCAPADSSQSALLTVTNIPPPTILTQATSDSICEGNSKTFTVNATGTAINYRWLKGNDTLRNNTYIVGAGSPSITISPTRLRDSGWYRCMIFEDCGARTLSDSVKLDFYLTTKVTENPINVDTVEFVNAGFKVETEGINLKYQWYYGNTAIFNGPDYDGTNTDSLTIKDLRLGDVGFYKCKVWGDCGDTVTSLLGLLEVDPQPVITQQPDSASDCESSTVFFSVRVDGSNISYEWYKDGVKLNNGGNISGANTRTVVVSNISTADEGFYVCLVSTGPYTKVFSDSGKLKVKPIPSKPIVNPFGPTGVQSSVSGDIFRWYVDNVFDPSLTQQTLLNLTRVGDYRVRVTKDGCISPLSDPYFWFPTVGIAGVNAGNIKLYPNPASTLVDVEIPSNITNGNVTVYDIVGKQLSITPFTNATMFSLNVSNLSQGIYYVTVSSPDGKTYVGKLIKE